MLDTDEQDRGQAAEIDFADILCGVDGTHVSYEAVRQAATLAGPNGHLTLLAVTHVAGAGGAGSGQSAAISPAHAEKALERAAQEAREAGVKATTELDSGGPPARVLLDRAREHGLLAVGAPALSRLGGILIGGVAAVAAHTHSVALLVARSAPEEHPFCERIVVASDGLEGSDRLVELAARLAAREPSSVLLLHATGVESHSRPHSIATQQKRLEKALAERGQARVEPGRPHDVIVQAARGERASLIVIGSRGLTGVHSLGSVSERVVHDAPCSVLVVPPAPTEG
jgi:nucleotide-binding universal stress UspA family protein